MNSVIGEIEDTDTVDVSAVPDKPDTKGVTGKTGVTRVTDETGVTDEDGDFLFVPGRCIGQNYIPEWWRVQ